MRKNKISAILNLTEDDTLLHPLTQYRPIAALPFAARYRVIDFNLSNISHANIESVAMFIAGSGRAVYDHIRSGAAWGLESGLRGGIFTYSQTLLKQQIREQTHQTQFYYTNHWEFLEKSQSEYVAVMGSKMIANIDYLDVKDKHEESGKDITVLYKTISAKEIEGDGYGKVLVLNEEGEFSKLVEVENYFHSDEQVHKGLNMYFLSVRTLQDIMTKAQKEHIYMDTDQLLMHYIPEYKVNAYEHTAYLANIRSIQSYYNTSMNLLDKDTFESLFYEKKPVITKVKNEAPTYYAEQSNVTNSMVATGGFIEGTVDHSILFRKVRVDKGAEVRNSIIMAGSEIGEGAILDCCILDKDVVVEPGAVLRGTKENPKIVEKKNVVKAVETGQVQ